MYEDDEIRVETELTDDGLFMAYLPGRTWSYALGETADEARANLLERYELQADGWADPDEYAYLSAAWH